MALSSATHCPQIRERSARSSGARAACVDSRVSGDAAQALTRLSIATTAGLDKPKTAIAYSGVSGPERAVGPSSPHQQTQGIGRDGFGARHLSCPYRPVRPGVREHLVMISEVLHMYIASLKISPYLEASRDTERGASACQRGVRHDHTKASRPQTIRVIAENYACVARSRGWKLARPLVASLILRNHNRLPPRPPSGAQLLCRFLVTCLLPDRTAPNPDRFWGAQFDRSGCATRRAVTGCSINAFSLRQVVRKRSPWGAYMALDRSSVTFALSLCSTSINNRERSQPDPGVAHPPSTTTSWRSIMFTILLGLTRTHRRIPRRRAPYLAWDLPSAHTDPGWRER